MKYLLELEVNKAKPICFEGYQLGKSQQLVSKAYTHTWALANFLATPKEIKTNIDDENLQTVEQQDQFEEKDAQSLGTAEIVSSQIQDTQSAD